MDERPLLLVRYHFEGEAFGRIADRFEIVVTDGPVLARSSADQLERAFGIWTFGEKVDEELLQRMPKLRVVVNYGVGVDGIDRAALARRGVAFVLPVGANADAVADRAFALLLAVRHRIVESDALVRRGEWSAPDYLPMMGGDVYGTRLGIVGLGAIGRAVARRARGFAMEVRYSTPRRLSADLEDDLGVTHCDLEEMLAWAEAVSLHCPLTDQTRGLLSRDRLALMRPDAVLINTARGGVIDQTALIEMLAGGRLAGAGLDVVIDEPHVPAALLALSNVVLTPHTADATPAAERALMAYCVDEVLNLLD